MYEAVSALFGEHPDLLDEFSQFLPGPDRADGGGPMQMGGGYGDGGGGPHGCGGLGGGGGYGAGPARAMGGPKGRGRAGGRGAHGAHHHGALGGGALGGGLLHGGGAGGLGSVPVNEATVSDFFFRCRRTMARSAFFELLKGTDMFSRNILDGRKLMAFTRPLFVPGHEALCGAARRHLPRARPPRAPPHTHAARLRSAPPLP